MGPCRSWSSAVIRRWSESKARTVVSRTVPARSISTLVSDGEKVADHAPSEATENVGTRKHPPGIFGIPYPKGAKHKTSAVQVRRNPVEAPTDGLQKSTPTSDRTASSNDIKDIISKSKPNSHVRAAVDGERAISTIKSGNAISSPASKSPRLLVGKFRKYESAPQNDSLHSTEPDIIPREPRIQPSGVLNAPSGAALPCPESIFKTYTLTENGIPRKSGHQRLLASRPPLLYPSPVRDFSLLPVKIVRGRLNKLQEDAVKAFKLAFKNEVPLLLRPPQESEDNGKPDVGIPALRAGFDHYHFKASGDSRYKLWNPYWKRFGHVHVPYELVRIAANSDSRKEIPGSLAHFRAYLETKDNGPELAELIPEWTNKNQITAADWKPSDLEFHHFRAPLMLFIHAAEYGKNAGIFDGFPWMPKFLGLYVAQAQLAELPYQLQKEFPPPRIILEAGKGDIYDANIWLGTPPTYTPLHKDPNPNLFVQLAGNKMVRLLNPSIGRRVFRDVQAEIGASASATFRGEEMMQGPERELLEKAVWGSDLKDYVRNDCREILVKPGDALFIPKGWWHSFKSMGPTMTASVNWWFR